MKLSSKPPNISLWQYFSKVYDAYFHERRKAHPLSLTAAVNREYMSAPDPDSGDLVDDRVGTGGFGLEVAAVSGSSVTAPFGGGRFGPATANHQRVR